MNVPQYGIGQHHTFHQDVGPILQQFAAKFAANSDGMPSGSGLVVMGADGVRYHCTTTAPTQPFSNTQLNNPERNKQDTDTMTSAMNNATPTNPNSSNHLQHNPFPTQNEEQTANNQINQPYNLPSNTTQNLAPQKADASTMTEKEIQTNDSMFIHPTLDQEGNKSSLSSYSVPTMVSPSATWQSLAGPPGSTVAEYLSRLPASTLPLTLHHFLKFSTTSDNVTTSVKKEEIPQKKKKKRKYKKKAYIPRPPRPRPGEIRLTTALDGSTLYCCPECHMAYPERDLLEQHLVVHRLERRFVCDICGAGLKRKEHLDRHKQGHNPDRPYVCTVCTKAFKRNEHLSRHFIIHSGDKSQICTECGKGFYRKDHLRKHAQSHIAKRLRSELMGQKTSAGNNLAVGQQTVVSLASMVSIANSAPPPGVTAVALMPGGATLPILSS